MQRLSTGGWLDDFILPNIQRVSPSVNAVHVRSDGCKAQFKCDANSDWCVSRQKSEGCGLKIERVVFFVIVPPETLLPVVTLREAQSRTAADNGSSIYQHAWSTHSKCQKNSRTRLDIIRVGWDNQTSRSLRKGDMAFIMKQLAFLNSRWYLYRQYCCTAEYKQMDEMLHLWDVFTICCYLK